MFVNECTTGLLVSCSSVSKDVKTLTKVLKSVYDGAFTMHIWEGDSLIKMFGKYGQQIIDKRTEMLADAASNVSLHRYLSTTPSGRFCVTHALSSAGECRCALCPLTPLLPNDKHQLDPSHPPQTEALIQTLNSRRNKSRALVLIKELSREERLREAFVGDQQDRTVRHEKREWFRQDNPL